MRLPGTTAIVVTAAITSIFALVGGIIWAAFGAVSDSHVAQYGRVDIPGQAVLHLPKGEVDVSYREVGTTTSGSGLYVLRSGLSVTRADGDGPDPTLKQDYGSTIVVNGDAHRRVFRMQVPQAADYRVRADGARGGRAPQFLFGHGTKGTGKRALLAIGVPIAIWLLAIALLIANRRRRPPAAPPMPMSFPIPTGPPVSVRMLGDPGDAEAERIAALEKLDDLHKRGALSDAEFEAEKRRVLS